MSVALKSWRVKPGKFNRSCTCHSASWLAWPRAVFRCFNHAASFTWSFTSQTADQYEMSTLFHKNKSTLGGFSSQIHIRHIHFPILGCFGAVRPPTAIGQSHLVRLLCPNKCGNFPARLLMRLRFHPVFFYRLKPFKNHLNQLKPL